MAVANDSIATLVDSAEARDVRAELAAIMAGQPRLTQAAIAKESGISSTAVSQWLSGTYAGANDAVAGKIARWIDLWRERERRQQALPDAPEWITTPSAQRVLSALSYAQLAGDIVVAYGGAGLGKTRACEQFARTNPNVWIATMSPATATVVPALEEIADALGLRDMAGGAARIQRAVIRRLRGTAGLMIIDEAQHLGTAALDAVRALHDATGVGLALVGNEQVYARMTGGNRAAYLDRLYSRIGKRVHLKGATRDDVDALIGAWKFADKACVSLCRDIASRPGGLRVLTKVLRLATLYGAGSGRAVCCDDVRAAWHELGAES